MLSIQLNGTVELTSILSLSTKDARRVNKVTLPNRQLISEVNVFANFMKTKIVREKMDIAIMSEASLSKDWMKPEEDDAWQNL